MIFVLTHLLGLASLAALTYATGWWIETLGAELPDLSLSKFVTRIAVGSVAWIYASFALAALGGYRPIAVLLLAASVVAALLLQLRSRARANGHGRPALGAALDRRTVGLAVLSGLAPAAILLALVVRASSWTVGWDDDVYHLVLPKLYLRHGGFVRVPFNVYSHWPHNVELLFGLAMMLDDYVLAKLVHTAYLALLATAVFQVSRRHCSRIIASLATLLVLGNDVVLYEGAVANIDIAFAFYFLLAVACADAYLRAPSARALIWSGVFCGVLAGTKLSGLAGVACVAALLILRTPALLLQPRELSQLAFRLGAPTLLLALPWYAKSYLYTGNPLYPLFFRQLGGIEWSEEIGRQFFDWQHGMGMGRSPRDYLLLPLRVITEGSYDYGHFDGFLAQTWLVAIPLAIALSVRQKRGRSELIASGLYFAFWALSSQQLRFLIAVLPLLAIATGFALEGCLDWVAHERARVLQGAALWLATAVAAWPMIRLTAEPALQEAKTLLPHGPGDPAAVVWDGYAFINQHTPAGARVLLFNENRGFFLDRDYIADSFPEASQLGWFLGQARSEAEVRAFLDGLGVTHLYVRGARRRRTPLPATLARLLDDPGQARRISECGRGCKIYELR